MMRVHLSVTPSRMVSTCRVVIPFASSFVVVGLYVLARSPQRNSARMSCQSRLISTFITPFSCALQHYSPSLQVVRLQLSFNGLHGVLPPSLGLLKALRVLDLSGNRLKGRHHPKRTHRTPCRQTQLMRTLITQHVSIEVTASTFASTHRRQKELSRSKI